MKLRIYAVLAMAVAVVFAIPTLGSANLLVEGGFENNNLAPLGAMVTPLTPGLWGYEAASDVTSGNGGIMPRTGRWMLEMNNDQISWTQTLQFVDITALSTLKVEAHYNSDAIAAIANLSLIYYANNFAWGSPITTVSQNLTLDSNTGTWEAISFTDTKPLGANWVGVQVAFSDASIGDRAGYVDDAALDAVPEPSSLAAFGTGTLALAGTLFRRRRA